MTLTWATIPREILYQILELLKDDSKTMIQLQLTCRNWQLLAQAVMYKAIRLPPAEDPKSSLLIESLQLPDKDYASKVIEIRFSSYSSTLDRNNLAQIIRSCPNVKCVEQATYDQPDNHYPLLLQLHRQGYLCDLEKVRIPESKRYGRPRNDHTIKDYIYLMLELKESAKQLYVSFNHTTDGSVSLIPALEEFKHLEEIIFGESNGISFAQLDQVLRGEHPLLKKVTVYASRFAANEQDNTPITKEYYYLHHRRLLFAPFSK